MRLPSVVSKPRAFSCFSNSALILSSFFCRFAHEPNGEELAKRITELAFSLLPKEQQDQFMAATTLNGKRLDELFHEARELLNQEKYQEAAVSLRALTAKCEEGFGKESKLHYFSFRNPFEYHLYRMLYPGQSNLERAPYDFAMYCTLYGYALVELVNLYDDSLEFEAIHRVLFGVDPKKLMADFLAAYPGAHYGEGEGHQITYVLPGGEKGVVTVPNPTAQLEVGTLQTFLDKYLEENGGKIDYIHGEDVVENLVSQPDSIGFLLPSMTKDQLFPTVIFDGALPRKTFSMGEAHDKRFYMEARKIK